MKSTEALRSKQILFVLWSIFQVVGFFSSMKTGKTLSRMKKKKKKRIKITLKTKKFNLFSHMEKNDKLSWQKINKITNFHR